MQYKPRLLISILNIVKKNISSNFFRPKDSGKYMFVRNNTPQTLSQSQY